jgi:hypothetical protein
VCSSGSSSSGRPMTTVRFWGFAGTTYRGMRSVRSQHASGAPHMGHRSGASKTSMLSGPPGIRLSPEPVGLGHAMPA